MPSAKSDKGQAGCLVASIMLVVVSIGTFTFCSLEQMRIHKSGDKFKNMQSFGVYGFDPEVTPAPLNTNSSLETDFSAQVDSTPEPLMSSVETQEPQLSSVKSIDDDEAQYEYKFDDDKKAFIKYKKTEEHEDNQSKYLQFMKDTYDIDLNENTKDEQPQVDMKEMMNEQPVLKASPVLEESNSGSQAEMIKKKQGVTDEASASPNLKAGVETIDSDSEAEYEKYVKNLQGLDLNEKQSPDEQMFKGDERNSEQADYLKERYGIDLNGNADRKADPKNQDEIDERQILELLRDNSSAHEEDNTATQPMLQASNPVDAEKNHREQREYMMKLYDIDIDDQLTGNASNRDVGAEPVQPVLRTSNTNANAEQDTNTQDDEEIKMQEYLNLLKQMDEEENTPSLRAPMDNDREMYRDFENILSSSQADDELEGPIVSPTPFIRGQPSLSSSYDDVSDNNQDMRSNGSDNLDAEYADYMKRLQSINIDDAN